MSHHEQLASASIESSAEIKVSSVSPQEYVAAKISSRSGAEMRGQKVAFKAAKLRDIESHHYDKEGSFWIKKQGNHASGSATQETSIYGGAVVDASEVSADIATHKSPLKTSIRVSGGEEVKYNYAPSSFESSSYKHKGLTEEAMFAISSVATIATGGVMASSMSGVTLASNAVVNAAMHGGIIAGASALASSAAVNLANNQGHLGRTLRDTTSRKNLESIGKSALIGGITGGVLEGAGLNGDLSQLSGKDLYSTIAKKVLAEELVSTAISGADPSKIAERVGQRTVLAVAQHKVGDMGVAAKLPDGGIAKMALHGAVAGAFAQATGDKFGRGFAGGAVGEYVGAKLYKGKGYEGYDPSREIAGLSAGVASMALGGSAKSMGRASQAATSAETYNRSLHSDETRIRQALSEEHSLEEMNAIDDRIMARIRGSDGVSDKASGKETISGMQARGNANPNARRIDSIINKKAKELGIDGAFEYTWQDYMSDSISKREELWGRSKGGIRAGAGAALGVASSYAAVGSGGLAAGVSYLGMAAGADMMVSGSSEAFGTYHHKEGYRVLRSLTKPTLSYMQETSRDAAITAVEYGLAAGSTRLAGKVADAGGVVIAKASKKIAARKPAPKKELVQKVAKGGKDISLGDSDFGNQVRAYVKDLETRSGIKMTDTQKTLLKNDLRSRKYIKLSPESAKSHKDLYRNPKVKERIINDWEKNTKKAWPVYQEDVLSKSGKVLFKKGDKVQAHHIKHQSHGGEHEWYNIFPLHTKQHQSGIHLKGAPGELLHGK